MIKKLLLLNCLLAVVIITTSKKVKAQEKEQKEVKIAIIINDGDTTVNGKKFKNLSEEEKTELRKEFNQVEERRISMKAPHVKQSITIVGKRNAENDSMIFEVDSTKMRKFSYTIDGKSPRVIEFKRDSLLRKLDGMNIDREIILGRSLGDEMDWEMVHPRRAMPGRSNLNPNNRVEFLMPNSPNSNNFSYSTTDNDGFTTRINYTISEPSNTELKNTFKDEKIAFNSLNISDVMLVPNFSTGKTTLTFTSKAKGALNIKMIDSAGNAILSENKTLLGESYSNTFSASRNGNYFLQISQGSQTFIRKVNLMRN